MRLDDLDTHDRIAVCVPVAYLPMRWCHICDGERPHISTDHYSTCLACGRTEL
jgi:hypothetical protein